MVFENYKSLHNIYANIITRHIYKYCYPINKNRPFVILAKILLPAVELMCKFTHSWHDLYFIRMTRPQFINDDECFKICEDVIMDYLGTTSKDNKDILYELTNYIISNYKPSYEFEDMIYNSIPTIKKPVKKCLRIMNYLELFDAKKSVENLNNIIHMFIRKTFYSVYVDIYKFENENKFTDALLVSTAAIYILKNKNISFNYDLRPLRLDREYPRIQYNESDETNEYVKFLNEDYNDLYEDIYDEYYDDDFEASIRKYIECPLIKKYDSAFLLKPTISLYSTFINLLENIEERQLHKCILRGISNKEINLCIEGDDFVTLHSSYKKYRWFHLRPSVLSECLLFYYISKSLTLSKKYEIINTAYIELSKMILKLNPKIKQMFDRESNFIKKHFKYGSNDDVKEEFIELKIRKY